jgi:hypothetical protein
MHRSIAVVLFGLCAGTLFAQTTASKPVEPTVIGQVYLLDSTNQTLQKLPQEQWKAIGKAGWGGAWVLLQVEGTASSFRVKGGDKAEFVFTVQNAEQVRVYAAVIKGKNRQAELVQIKNGFAHQQRTQSQGISVVVTKYGESSFKLVPERPLDPGEYFIDVAGKLYTFGVD